MSRYLTALAIAAVASFVIFVLRESTTGHPLIDFRLFRKNSLFLSTNLAALFLYISVYSVLTGYDYTSAVTLAAFATVGAIVLQIPLGYFAGNRDPRIILLFTGTLN